MSYSASDSFFITGNTTLYAHWVANASTHTITYDGNTAESGTEPVDATVYAHLAQVTVLGNTGTLAKTGYTFTGWNTSADGSGDSYTGGETFFIGAPTTLYAQWTANDYTVSFDANGAPLKTTRFTLSGPQIRTP